MKLKSLCKDKRDELQKVNAEKAMLKRKTNMCGKKDNQDTSKRKVISKETSDESI